MPDPVAKANHEAKEAVNGKLDQVNDVTDDLEWGDVNRTELPNGSTNDERLQRFKDDVEEEMDLIQQDVNSGSLVRADNRIRRLRDRLRQAVRNNAKRQQLIDALDAAEAAKLTITQPGGIAAGTDPDVDADNHAARRDAGGKLGEVKETVDDLDSGDVNRSRLPDGTTTAGRIRRLKDEIAQTIDEIHEDIRNGRIAAADDKIRRLRARLRRTIRDREKLDAMLDDLTAVRRAKRRITEPPQRRVAMLDVDNGAFLAAAFDAVADFPLAKGGVPAYVATALDKAGISTVGQFLRVGQLRTVRLSLFPGVEDPSQVEGFDDREADEDVAPPDESRNRTRRRAKSAAAKSAPARTAVGRRARRRG